ncbi:MAG: hypothetical protein IK955_00530 [Clostridia bacterium]|nr:hypothetical protein [Clostridia bacterium]
MTDISVKNRIIAILSFTFAAVILSVRNALTFTLVFFVCLFPVLFFADKILNGEKIKERTAFAFFVFAVCYQTFFQFFNRTHENTIQLMIASVLALFLAGVFAATSVKNLPYSILVAIIICFLDIRLASAYSLFLLTFSIVKLQLEIKGNKFRKSSPKKKNNKKKKNDKAKEKEELDPFFTVIISIIVSAACLVYCINAVFKNDLRITESIDYLLTQFKNTVGFSILILYLLIKLLRSEIKAKTSIVIGLILNIVPIPLYFINYGWSTFSLFLVSTALFLVLVCFENGDIIDSVKDSFHKHKYIFFVEILLLLQ